MSNMANNFANKVKSIHMPDQNMGTIDRVVRSALGAAMLTSCLGSNQSGGNRFLQIVGGAFLVYGLTGWDPLLSVFRSNTLPGKPDNVANRLREQMKHMHNGNGHKIKEKVSTVVPTGM